MFSERPVGKPIPLEPPKKTNIRMSLCIFINQFLFNFFALFFSCMLILLAYLTCRTVSYIPTIGELMLESFVPPAFDPSNWYV